MGENRAHALGGTFARATQRQCALRWMLARTALDSFDAEQRRRLRDGLDALVSFSVRIQNFGTRQNCCKPRMSIFPSLPQ
jgi:hypothetical protein